MDPCPKGLFTDNYWTRVFKGAFQGCIGGGRWPLVEIAQSSLTVIFKLVSLRLILGTVAAYAVGTVWSPFS